MAWAYSVGETIMLATAAGGILVTTVAGLLTAWRSGRIEKNSERIEAKSVQIEQKSARIEEKVDTVHDLTNSRLSRLEGELLATKNMLVSTIAALQQAEDVRKTLATETANVLRDQAVPVPQASGLLTAAGTPVPAKTPAEVFVVEKVPAHVAGDAPAKTPAEVFVVPAAPDTP